MRAERAPPPPAELASIQPGRSSSFSGPGRASSSQASRLVNQPTSFQNVLSAADSGSSSSSAQTRVSSAGGNKPVFDARGSTPEVASRGVSGRSTPQGRMRSGSRTPELGSRVASRCQTPDMSQQRNQLTMPLTSAQLENASQKLTNLRIGWGTENEESPKFDKFDRSMQEDASPTSPSSVKSGSREFGSILLPSTPLGKKDQKWRRPLVRPFDGAPFEERSSSQSSSQRKKGQREDGPSSHRSLIHKSRSFNLDSKTQASSSSSSSADTNNLRNARASKEYLGKGSRDDSFLSTISESTRSTDSSSTDRESKINVADGSQIEVYSETHGSGKGVYLDVLKDFQQVFVRQEIQGLLRNDGFDKPLEMQRRIIPLIMSAFTDEQKSFIIVQGAPQCGKTSALALGILASVGPELPGIRAIVLSTGPARDFRKCFDICAEGHPAKLTCFERKERKVLFEGEKAGDQEPLGMHNTTEDMHTLSAALLGNDPAVVFGHPSRVLPLLQEAPTWGIDLSNIQVLALDDAEEAICQGLIDEVCEVCTILRHFSKQRLRHVILSHFLSNEAKSMIRCLKNSLLRQQNLFGIRAHRTQARAKRVNHYYAVAPRHRWPSFVALLHHSLSLPSGIIFDDASSDARTHSRAALRTLGITASIWNALHEQGAGARAAARDCAVTTPKGPAFHLMPSDLVVLKVDLPQVRCVLHFDVPRRELSIYGLRLMCLEQQDRKKPQMSGKSLSVLFVEEAEIVRELEKTFHIRMQEVPTEMLPG